MNNQDKKEYLRQYQDIVREIDCMEDELAGWYAQLEKVTASYNGMPSGSGSTDKMAGMISNICEMKDKINDKIAARTKMRSKIEDAIESTRDARLRVLLRRKYIDGWSFERIAYEMNYSWRQTIRLHGIALGAIDVMECHIDK